MRKAAFIFFGRPEGCESEGAPCHSSNASINRGSFEGASQLLCLNKHCPWYLLLIQLTFINSSANKVNVVHVGKCFEN